MNGTMKSIAKFLLASAMGLFFVSCALPVYYDASGNPITEEYVMGSDGGQKGGKPAPVLVEAPAPAPAPVEEISAPPVYAQAETKGCARCLSHFCPEPDCCGNVSKEVLRRATAQGGTGEPHIGLIPTMKTLAPQN